MGGIARMLTDTPREITPLQKELNRVWRRLGIVVSLIALVMIATILLIEDIQGLA